MTAADIAGVMRVTYVDAFPALRAIQTAFFQHHGNKIILPCSIVVTVKIEIPDISTYHADRCNYDVQSCTEDLDRTSTNCSARIDSISSIKDKQSFATDNYDRRPKSSSISRRTRFWSVSPPLLS